MTRPRHLLTVFTAIAFLASCGPSKEETGKKTASIEKKLEAAEGALEEAKAAGAETMFPEEFAELQTKLEEARTMFAEGKSDKIGSRVASADRLIKDLLRTIEDTSKARKNAEEEKKKAEKEIAKAKKDKIDVEFKDVWEEIEKYKAQAEAEFNDPKKVASATSSYKRISQAVQEAMKNAKEAREVKKRAVDEKTSLADMEKQAKEAKAEDLAFVDLSRARGYVKDGDRDFEASKYDEALENFRRARDTYAEAIQRAKDAAALANPASGASGLVDEGKKVEGTPTEENPAAPTGEGKTAEGGAAPKAGEEVVGVEKKEKPEPVQVPDSELSAEDEEFLQTNIGNFTKGSGLSYNYDPFTAQYSIEYTFGDEMKKDVIMPRPVDPKMIEWKENIGGATIGSKEAKGQKDSTALGMSFAGNTRGMFLLPVPFKDELTMEYKVEIGVMRGDGEMTAILMSTPDGKNYYGANFGTIEAWRDGKKAASQPPPNKDLRKSPNMWFSKLKAVPMKIEYTKHPKDPKRFVVNIWYDADDAESPINSYTVPARSGMCGFSWFMTKFKVRLLKITGKVDKQLAVKRLKGGDETAKASKPAKKPAKEDPEKDAGTGDDAGATPPASPKPQTAKEEKKPANAKKAETEETDY